MNSPKLDNICRSDPGTRKYFLGVFSSDQLPRDVPCPCCFIANTKPKSHPGEHWVAIFVDVNRIGRYFCSYGLPPAPAFQKWLRTNTNDWHPMPKRIQGSLSTTCGQYCVCFLHFVSRDVTVPVFLSLFTTNRDENDAIVTAFINGMYNQSTRIAANV